MDKLALELRRGVLADAPVLADFAARTFAETFGPANRPEDLSAYLAKAYGVPQQSRELADPDYITLLIGNGSELVAYAQVRRHSPPPCVSEPAPIELYRFYVERTWQGRGLAPRLMDAVYDAAAALGGRTLWLGVWERNHRAIAFYEKCGFQDAGAQDFFVGSDQQTDRVMVRTISARVSESREVEPA
jgi:ribosomal protein S18 acetylase RimI-like enzyme